MPVSSVDAGVSASVVLDAAAGVSDECDGVRSGVAAAAGAGEAGAGEAGAGDAADAAGTAVVEPVVVDGVDDTSTPVGLWWCERLESVREAVGAAPTSWRVVVSTAAAEVVVVFGVACSVGTDLWAVEGGERGQSEGSAFRRSKRVLDAHGLFLCVSR